MSKDHGWVDPAPNKPKARCGGPCICPTCALEWARKTYVANRDTRPEWERPRIYPACIRIKLGSPYGVRGSVLVISCVIPFKYRQDLLFRDWDDIRNTLCDCPLCTRPIKPDNTLRPY